MAENILELLAKYEPKEGENFSRKLYFEPARPDECDMGVDKYDAYVADSLNDVYRGGELSCHFAPNGFLSLKEGEFSGTTIRIYNNFSPETPEIAYNEKPSYSVRLDDMDFFSARDFNTKALAIWLTKNAKELEGTFSEYTLIRDGLDGDYMVKEAVYRMGSIESKSSGLLANKINFLNFLMGDYDAIKFTGEPVDYKYWENCKIDISHVPVSHTKEGLYFGTGSNQTVYDEYGPGKQTETTVFSAVSLQRGVEKEVFHNDKGKWFTKENVYYRLKCNDAVNDEEPYVNQERAFRSLREAGSAFISECERVERKHHGERNKGLVSCAAERHYDDFAKLEQSRSVSEDTNKPKEADKQKTKTVER